MTVTINARGTSHSRFQIGKAGPSIDAQGVVKAASGGSVEIQTDYGAAITVGSDGSIDLSTPALNINGKVWPEISGTATQVLIANTHGEMEWDTLTEYAAPVSHVGSGGSQHSNATSTTAGFMSPSDKVRLDGLTTDVSGVPLLNPLLIYYGYPIAYKGLWDVSAVVADITANYKYWVVGHTYQDPLHEEYASTVSIIQAVRAAGVVVYGYIPLGTTSYNYTISQIGDIADQWTAIGIDGIFLDEYGFDYGNSRQRQIDAVTVIHAKSLPVCANAWVAEEFMCDTLTETGWNTDDWRYVRWVEKNPTDLASPMALGDSYLIENFCYDHLGPVSIWDAQERVAHIRQLATDKGASLWAVAVFGETTPGYVDIGKLGSLGTLQQCGEYISANAYLYDIGIVGSGGFSFGSNGTPVSAPIYRMPTKANVPELPATNNYTTKTAVRFFGSVRLEITNTDTIQSVSINGAIEPVIGDKSSEYATKTDIADHEAAADPHPQYATAAEAAAAAPVQSVAGKTGAVTLAKADVGLSKVDNTSDAEKPISTAAQIALDAKQATITGAASSVVTSNLAASRALVSDASGKIAVSSNIAVTELGYLSGVTANIQAQLDSKADASAIGDITAALAAINGA